MNVVLEWVKANVLIVVFVALMLAALIALPMVASGMNAEIAKDVDTRARKLNELSRLEQTQVAAPGGAAAGATQAALVNEQLLESFRGNVRVAQEDADQVLARAIEHNRKGRGVLMDNVFPAPPSVDAELTPQWFHERLVPAYDELLESVNAGSPPSLEELRSDLERRELQFRTHTLSKDMSDPLTEEERNELRTALTNLRLLRYAEAASTVSMYASTDSLEIPGFDHTRPPSLAELYDWQWKYWIHEDILKALHQANEGYPSVVEAPVKHVVWIGVGGSLSGGSSSRDGGSGRGGMMMGAGGGASSGGGGGMAAGPANPKAEAPQDFSISFTGRTTNPLYDVRYVDLELIVDTTQIPIVLDALAKYNFMTVLRMRTVPADAFIAAASGYYYGAAPITQLSLRVETVWFRQWTSQFMPESVREQLGVVIEETSYE